MKKSTVKKIERFGDRPTTRILFIILALIVLVFAFGVIESIVYAYSGTSNITAATVNDARVDPSASVTWTVGPIFNGTVNPIQNGWGMEFDGGGADYVNVTYGATLNNTGDWSYTAWINPNSTGENAKGYIIEGIRTGYNFRVDPHDATTYDLVWFFDGGSITSLTKPKYGAWTKFTCTYNDTSHEYSLYINGTLDLSNTGNEDTPGSNHLIIADRNAGARAYDGIIDEMKLYGRLLKTGEILYDYTNKVPLNQTSLDLWVDFDSNVQDQSGNGNNGAINGNPVYVRGIRGKAALTLDGTGDYVSAGSDASLDNLEEYSYELRFKVSSIPADAMILSKVDNYLQLRTTGRIDAIQECSGIDSSSRSNNGAFLIGIYYHIVMTYDNTTASRYASIFLNGNEVSYSTQTSPTGPIDDNSGRTQFLGSYNGAASSLNGTIDEIRIYNRTLSPTEIAEHYQGIYSNETGLVLYLDFDGQVQDHSGEGNNGAVNGDPEYSDGWASCPVSTSYNGTGGTTVELVNCTTGLCTIPDTAPATYGNYTVNTTVPAASANATYLGFIADHYLVDLHTSYGETEAGFRALITATGESVIDEHEVAYDDALNVAGIGAMTWSNYTDCFQDTVTSNIATTVTYDTVTSFLEATYGITSAEINTTVTVTWTTSTLDRLQTKFMQGDWIGAIFDEEAYLVDTLTLYTFILGTISIAVWNVTGPYGTFVAWLLGWIIFAATIHGPAQSMALLLFALGCGIMLAKLYLDRRTT